MAQPFLKWAGGKRWLVNAGLPLPTAYDRYIEPFLGGAAVYFSLNPERAILSDINFELINLYLVMRDAPDELLSLMRRHHRRHSKEHYYKIRGSLPTCKSERAARTLYLNRTCWNGLYRVNLKGEFNVPMGTKMTVLMTDDDFHMVSGALQGAEIECCDFEKIVNLAGPGDFVFLDPPYTVKHNVNGFIKYNEHIFTWADQVRLRNAAARAIGRGAAVLITNADHPSVRELYTGVAQYRSLPRSSVLAASSHHRGFTSEALFIANLGDGWEHRIWPTTPCLTEGTEASSKKLSRPAP